MESSDTTQEFVEFFKALADRNRLKIIGLLAIQPYSVEQLAEILHLGSSTVSHHLSYLAHIGLVSARAEGYYSVYQLETDALENMAKRLLTRETLPALAEDLDLDAYDRKVIKDFTTADGRIKSFPAQEKKFMAILRYTLKEFEPGKRYSEKQVNEILSRFHEDTASLRRGFIEFKYMARQNGEYWRIEN
ncbi:MAG TPA: metalloregulator ArsR/SmtB family transcription factor [Anaerolineaceae bacterium]|nr:metalloregulator ArsR/SmtB family transcription factor [Anaerolineaceae bacterium]